MTKHLNTQNEWIILMSIGAVPGSCRVYLDVKKNTQTKAMNQSSVGRNPYCYSWYEANISGLQVRNKNKLIKVKSEISPLLQIHINTKCVISPLFKINMHHQMWNRVPTPYRYAKPATT